MSVHDPTAAAHAATNGGSDIDADFTATLRQQIEARRAHVTELQAELAATLAQLRRYERALALLADEQPARKASKPKTPTGQGGPKRINDGQLAQIREAVLAYAADHEEFRQVDLRTTTGIGSSNMAIAFELLRQENVIRFARKDGNNKYFRLTREALAKDTAR